MRANSLVVNLKLFTVSANYIFDYFFIMEEYKDNAVIKKKLRSEKKQHITRKKWKTYQQPYPDAVGGGPGGN